MIFQIFGSAVLLIFYGIFFLKMLAQKKRGIRTSQIGTRKEKSVRTVEKILSAATLGIVPVQLFSILTSWSILPDNARLTGFFCAMLGDVIFFFSIRSMKDSWRAGIPANEKTKFISGGIYAYSRNPAFFGFDLMYIGICLLFCNILTLLFTLFAVTALHLQILEEEKYLEQTFGTVYRNYKKQVFRYLGRRK